MKTLIRFLLCLNLTFIAGLNAQTSQVLIKDIHIFNGKSERITKATILIEGQLIKQISSSEISVNENAVVIDGTGKYVMPGLIDAHVHVMFESISQSQAMLSDFAFLNLFAAKAAEEQLMRGFTTVRDLGGGSLSLARAIDMGLAKGPRIFSSGAFISQTGGHGDFGLPTDVPRKIGELSYVERNGIVAIADGVDQVLMRSREQLRQGATQLKLMAGGGVASSYDPLDVTQYTYEEFKAAVSAAENWGTYVTVHAYTPNAIQTAIRAGVKCIDHGQLADEATAKLMAEKGIWWSLQPFLDDEDANKYPEGSANRAKQIEVSQGTDNAYRLAKKYKIKTAWGTDNLFNAVNAQKQGKKLTKLTRWYTPFEVLKMATADNAELLNLSGKRNPYQKGALGVIEEGAYADLIILNENPLENIHLIENPHENFQLIMKDGVIYKNALNK